MIGGRPSTSLVLGVVLFACILLTYLGPGSARNRWGSTPSPVKWTSSPASQGKSDVFNRTLGFEKVFVIGLPERSDKRDALALMSSLTGFRISWIAGVAGNTIPKKALPFGWDRETMRDSNLGSWRGHVNAMRRIIEDGISSALIMEDDMDWDVNIKEQLVQFAAAARSLQNGFHRNQTLETPSPYGQDWDMLWLGSCVTTFDEDLPEDLQIPSEERDSRKVFIYNDPTVPPPGHILGNGSFSWDDYPPRTRIVYVPGDNVCSFAYALSAAGAQKALQHMGLEGQRKPFDNHLSDLCRLRINGMRCVSIVPSLFIHHRPKGKISSDSDINKGSENEEMREVGFTENILYSTRLNLKNLVRGLRPEKQWVD
ncbi:putative glycosyltransferase family 25 protein [Daldinia childiae]|uniref:putative glycosyltransferase family 25 protein n=1 Tax=Daldinia childiae TaxID=326645 RepID=UPI001448873B|nr:putative glycosyltransferase family 25 protein [Daldinia childiae]KAF3056409.1 putative glycosyltransferase family 25 protein [Daldinia childiae]